MPAFTGVLATPTLQRNVRTWATVVLLAGTLSCSNAPREIVVAGPPRVRFDEDRHDWGRITAGTPVRARFSFRNEGQSDLRIDRFRTVSDSEAVAEPPGPWSPGAAGMVEVTLDTADLAGSVRRTVTVHTNDPEQPAVLLELTGIVDAEVTVEPAALYLGAPPHAPRTKGELEVRLARGVTLVAVTTSPAAAFTVQTRPSDDGRALQLLVATRPDAPPGPFDGEVILRTTAPRRATVRVPVVGWIAGATAVPD
jgi:hypothetical protein